MLIFMKFQLQGKLIIAKIIQNFNFKLVPNQPLNIFEAGCYKAFQKFYKKN